MTISGPTAYQRNGALLNEQFFGFTALSPYSGGQSLQLAGLVPQALKLPENHVAVAFDRPGRLS